MLLRCCVDVSILLRKGGLKKNFHLKSFLANQYVLLIFYVPLHTIFNIGGNLAPTINKTRKPTIMNYFIVENGQQAGPYSIDELLNHGLNSDTLVWAEGMNDWTPAWQVEELKAVIYDQQKSTATPPPITPTMQQTSSQQTSTQQTSSQQTSSEQMQ